MQRFFTALFVLSSLSWVTLVQAADETVTILDGTDQTTVITEKEVTRGFLKDEKVGIKPQLGVLAFRDLQGNATSRMAGGFTLDGNFTPMINRDWSNWYMGLTSGFIFSHLGDPTSNFLGTSPTASFGSSGANFFVIPANLKIGYNLTDNFRLSAHGGGNVVYRSVANALNLGTSSAGSSPVWRLFPNVGADAELSLGKNVSVMLRPDFTFTPGDTFFTGTLGLGIALG